MIVNAVIYTIPDVDRALAHFRALQAGSRAEAGCRAYTVHQSIEDEQTFFLYEEWEDRAALDEHYTTPHFQEHGVRGIREIATSRTAVICAPIG